MAADLFPVTIVLDWWLLEGGIGAFDERFPSACARDGTSREAVQAPRRPSGEVYPPTTPDAARTQQRVAHSRQCGWYIIAPATKLFATLTPCSGSVALAIYTLQHLLRFPNPATGRIERSVSIFCVSLDILFHCAATLFPLRDVSNRFTQRCLVTRLSFASAHFISSE